MTLQRRCTLPCSLSLREHSPAWVSFEQCTLRATSECLQRNLKPCVRVWLVSSSYGCASASILPFYLSCLYTAFTSHPLQTVFPPALGAYTNRQRVLVFGSRGMTARFRHFMSDIRDLIPHHKKDAKVCNALANTRTHARYANGLIDAYVCAHYPVSSCNCLEKRYAQRRTYSCVLALLAVGHKGFAANRE